MNKIPNCTELLNLKKNKDRPKERERITEIN